MRIYIFGTGKGLDYVERCLCEDVQIIAYIDNYKEEGATLNNIPIIKQEDISNDYDYVVVSLMIYKDIVLELEQSGIDRDKIISFFDFNDADDENKWQILDSFKWRAELQWKHYKEYVMPLLWNINYELSAERLLEDGLIPKILPADEAIQKIVDEHCSMVRFGDNEFEQIRGKERVNYQDVDNSLAVRLKEVLNSSDEKVIVAIADNYGSLDKYTNDAASAIREYLTPETREAHMKLLDKNKTYYDAYISRPYLMYRDKSTAKKRFNDRKRIWENQDILIVEGKHTRFGVGNDLLDNAKSIARILCPDKNSYLKYDEIINTVKDYGKNRLILIILGPTATILAYDLALKGYWAVDIGQLDTEYEWFLRNTQTKCEIPSKTVSELSRYSEYVTDENDPAIKKYFQEVVVQIGL